MPNMLKLFISDQLNYSGRFTVRIEASCHKYVGIDNYLHACYYDKIDDVCTGGV